MIDENKFEFPTNVSCIILVFSNTVRAGLLQLYHRLSSSDADELLKLAFK